MGALGGANDTLGPMLKGQPLTCDGCHPKDAGLTIMAQTIADAIVKAGQPSSQHVKADSGKFGSYCCTKCSKECALVSAIAPSLSSPGHATAVAALCLTMIAGRILATRCAE